MNLDSSSSEYNKLQLLVSDFQSRPSTSRGPIKKKAKFCFNMDCDSELEDTQYTNKEKVSIFENINLFFTMKQTF